MRTQGEEKTIQRFEELIPKGYSRVTDGAVRKGDIIWSDKGWIEVDDGVINDLAFLDAIAVEELRYVVRKLPDEAAAHMGIS